MALHDISKHGSMRIKLPQPNTQDVLPPETRMAHNTTQINYTSDDDADSTIGIKMRDGTIKIVDDNGDTRVLMGFDSGGF